MREFIQKNTFLLALIIHIFIFLFFSLIFIPKNDLPKSVELSIPSYVYQAESTPAVAKEIAPQEKKIAKPKIETSPHGIKKPEFDAAAPHPLTQLVPKSAERNSEPVHLVGEKGVPQPLIVLLGKALTAHLAYPKIAIDLRVQGVTVIKFLVHPDGQVTNVSLVQSSKATVLDEAALNAANHISPVKNVDLFLKEPKYIVFGIIFGGR